MVNNALFGRLRAYRFWPTSVASGRTRNRRTFSAGAVDAIRLSETRIRYYARACLSRQ